MANLVRVYLFTSKHKHRPSSRRVKRPICGKSLNVSRQISPPLTSILAIAIWSCFTNLGFICVFSPVFLSMMQISALMVTSSAHA